MLMCSLKPIIVKIKGRMIFEKKNISSQPLMIIYDFSMHYVQLTIGHCMQMATGQLVPLFPHHNVSMACTP